MLRAGEAFRAYQLAHDKNDHILMARARILQAATENAHVDEQLGEDADAAVHATAARQYSDEAITLAQQTQNRSLIAEAHLSRGINCGERLLSGLGGGEALRRGGQRPAQPGRSRSRVGRDAVAEVAGSACFRDR